MQPSDIMDVDAASAARGAPSHSGDEHGDNGNDERASDQGTEVVTVDRFPARTPTWAPSQNLRFRVQRNNRGENELRALDALSAEAYERVHAKDLGRCIVRILRHEDEGAQLTTDGSMGLDDIARRLRCSEREIRAALEA